MILECINIHTYPSDCDHFRWRFKKQQAIKGPNKVLFKIEDIVLPMQMNSCQGSANSVRIKSSSHIIASNSRRVSAFKSTDRDNVARFNVRLCPTIPTADQNINSDPLKLNRAS